MELQGVDKQLVLQRRRPELGNTELNPQKGIVPPACSQCRDAGYMRVDVPYGHPQFGKVIVCECRKASLKQQRQERLIRESGIYGIGSYKEATFATFQRFVSGVMDAYKQSLDFAKNPHGWLVLVGPSGCGKTHLAVAVASHRIDAGDTAIVQTVSTILDQLRHSFDPSNDQSYMDCFEEMQRVDLLVIDDLGTQNDTGWAREKLFQLLNYRYNALLPTVITSNGLDQVDFRLKSRLSDRRIVRMVNMFQAQDYRPLQELEGE